MRDAAGKIIKWKEIGAGTYNKTFVSEKPFAWQVNGKTVTQLWVMKTRKCNDPLNHAKRAVRLWNTINPKHPAVLYTEKHSWLAPYIKGQPASDDLVQQKLIQIYHDTRLIVWDGCGLGNMLVHNGKAFCVDVDQAFLKDDKTSEEAIKDIGLKKFNRYWRHNQIEMPKSVATIRTLIYLEKYLKPSDIQNKYLTAKSIDRLYLFEQRKLVISKNDLKMAAILDDKGFNQYFKTRQNPTKLTTTLVSRSHPVFKSPPAAQEQKASQESSWIPAILRLW